MLQRAVPRSKDRHRMAGDPERDGHGVAGGVSHGEGGDPPPPQVLLCQTLTLTA